MSVINTLHQHATHNSEKIAIVGSQGENITFGQLYACVICLGEYFDKEIETLTFKNDRPRICIFINDAFVNVFTVLGLNSIGAELVTLNPKLKAPQVAAFFDFTDADLAFTDDAGEALLSGSGVPIINIIKKTEEIINQKNKISMKTRKKKQNSAYDDDSPFIITLSSGSTGEPKPVIITERNKIDRTAQAVSLYGVSSKDVILNASPFFHSLGQRLTFVPILTGATLVLLEKFSVSRWINAVESHGVTFTIAVSSHLHALADILCSGNRLGDLRAIVSSSAGISTEVKKKLFKQKHFFFYEMYGATEVATATNQDGIQAGLAIDSVGKPCEGVEVVIYDKNSERCATGEIGEICVKSKLSSPGYLNSPVKTDASFRNGFFRTGDLGYLDENNFLFLRGRQTDLIISGGLNIFPQDVEGIIATHPSVIEVEVTGKPDNYLGEITVAVIATKISPGRIEPELRSLLRSKLASYQQPGLYIFVDQLPYQANGKRDKQAIKRLVMAKD